LNEDVIRRLISFYYGANSTEREILFGFLQAITQVELKIQFQYKEKGRVFF